MSGMFLGEDASTGRSGGVCGKDEDDRLYVL